jgi:hypothetical protein
MDAHWWCREHAGFSRRRLSVQIFRVNETTPQVFFHKPDIALQFAFDLGALDTRGRAGESRCRRKVGEQRMSARFTVVPHAHNRGFHLVGQDNIGIPPKYSQA